MNTTIRLIFVLSVLALTTGAAGAADSEGEAYFEAKIRPLLLAKCIDCHSSAKGKVKGGLDLDSAAGWRKGGDIGSAIVPGDPDKSPLIDAVRYGNEDLQMPPKGKMADHEIAALVEWVKRGAVDPRIASSTAPAASKPQADLATGQQFWAFRPVAAFDLPAVRDAGWTAGDVDRFILARLEAARLTPAADADPAALLRRVCLDLTGLPPTPAEVAAFVADPSPAAYEKAVDRLLASRAFGEKWGRHWLDVARYADNNGSSFNPPFREAYRYRNWVIDAVSADMPFDQFVVRQVAGDLLPASTQSEQDANVVATGFLMLGSKVLGMFEKDQLTLDVVDEQMIVVGQAFLGLTLGCARCHDHKFDPVTHRDYYAMAGIFASTVTVDDRIGGPKEDESDWSRRGLGDGGDERLRAFWKDHRYEYVQAGQKAYAARKRVDRLKAEQTKLSGTLLERKLAELLKAEKELAAAQTKLDAFERQLPEIAMAPRDATEPADQAIRIRGVAASLGEVVPRGFMAVAAYDGQPVVNRHQSGRLEFARWLASDKHPLTARVAVNRIWMNLFGEGLVRTPDNFGTRGDPPTHPELLDFLAIRFTAGGWSTKQLVRELVLSRTYRMSSAFDSAAASIDPENKLHWRHNRRRLTAEEIRDGLLLASGRLDPSPRPGPLLRHLPYTDLSGDDVAEFARATDERRTVYQPVARDYLSDVLEAFDFANPSLALPQRSRTTVAPQALYWLNSPFVATCAGATAKRVSAAEPLRDVDAVVIRAFKLICGRDPLPPEQKVLGDYLRTQFEGPPGPTDHDIGKLCQAIMSSNAFQFVE